MITPFDLHVLSTPPAFILSQDQTLLIKCTFSPIICLTITSVFPGIYLPISPFVWSGSKQAWLLFRSVELIPLEDCSFYCLFFVSFSWYSLNNSLSRSLSGPSLLLWIFRVALLFICQGSVPSQLSFSAVRLSYNSRCSSSCQRVFYKFLKFL